MIELLKDGHAPTGRIIAFLFKLINKKLHTLCRIIQAHTYADVYKLWVIIVISRFPSFPGLEHNESAEYFMHVQEEMTAKHAGY